MPEARAPLPTLSATPPLAEAVDIPAPGPAATARWRPDATGARQLVTTGALIAAVLTAMAGRGGWAALGAPILALLLVRLFVLQHDCGHRALLPRGNVAVGRAVGVFLGVPFDAWRAEHAWHHAHQGRLDLRGPDWINSPWTLREAERDPVGARRRARWFSLPAVAIWGALLLLVAQKHWRGFLMFRPGFRGRVPDAAGLVRRTAASTLAHVLAHAALAAALGPTAWAAGFLPAAALGAAFGATLFYVQHNFEHTWYAGHGWRARDVALRGSSYLAFPRWLAWCTADIGVHHVHHLDPSIPNHRLEEARRSLPEAAAVAPLRGRALGRCFTHVFWDEARRVMVPLPGGRP